MAYEEIRTELLKRFGAEDLWANRAVSLLDALEDTGIDPTSPTLLDDLIKAKDEHPKIAKWLENLPGISDGCQAKSEEKLGFLSMPISAAANRAGKTNPA